MNKSTLQSYKISFCTTCMNRLHHLKETLPSNLINNSTYANAEFVILNYNSKDEIDSWMEEKMMNEIRSQRLRYIKTIEPLFFKISHAKNLVTRFASGDIVCNIDADNFTGNGFAEYVNEQFNRDKNIFLTGGMKDFGDTYGRVCSWKSDFLKLRGYDERFLDWGFEDTDFCYRVNSQIKRLEKKITDSKYLKTIKHDHFERIKNGIYNSEIEFGLLLETKFVSKAYILKKGNKFEYLTIIPFSIDSSTDSLMIDKNEIRYGEWVIKAGVIEIKYNESKDIIIFSTNDGGQTYSTHDGVYQKIPQIMASYHFSALKGQLTYQENVQSKNEINVNGFGEGIVFEPFT